MLTSKCFKKSIYNIEVEKLENNKVLMYNSVSTALGIMDEKTQEIYYNIDKFNTDESIDKDVLKEIELMKTNGFIVGSEIDEYALLKIYGNMTRYNSRTFSLTIAPTMNCNMKCPYCYEDKKNIKMDEKIKVGLVNFIENYIKSQDVKFMTVCWYGGEPLLEKETIKYLSEKIIEICKENNVVYASDIITNGTMLDYETAKMLREQCFVRRAQITLDGMAETNDKRRCLINGKSSFEIITNNILKCQELINIVLRVNTDKNNIQEANDIIEYFSLKNSSFKLESLYFAPVDKQTETCNIQVSDCYSMNEFAKISALLEKEIYNKTNIVNYPMTMFSQCSAVGVNSYVVDPKGNFFKCWSEVGVDGKDVGNIFDGLIFNKRAIDWLSFQLDEECENCSIVPLCQGGCTVQKLDFQTKKCSYRALRVKETLKTYYEYHVKENKGKYCKSEE